MTHVNRPVAILMLISMTSSSCSSCWAEPSGIGGAHQGSAQSTSVSQPPADAPGLPPTGSQDPLSVDDVVARAKQLTAAIPRARYQVAAAAEALDSGVEPAFQFVRDQIGFESYSGVLRGSDGTLSSRAGNAADRALLLADLLTRKKIRTRFVLGQLDAIQAARLAARLFDRSEAGNESDAFAPSPAPFASDPFLSRVYARASRDYAAIRAALGPSVPAGASVPRDELLQELSQHVWIQAETDGRWIDLDPSFPDASPEKTFAAPVRTVDTLPSELHQHITIRVVAEALTRQSVRRVTSLEVERPAVDLIDRQIFLFHAPGSSKGGLAGAIEGAGLGRDTWAPVLMVDGQITAGEPIVMSEKGTDQERGQAPSGGFGGLFGQDGALAPNAAPFVGEWLEYEIRFPNGRRETISRPLIDRAGEAWRQARTFDVGGLRPLGRDAEGLLAPRQIHNIWFSAGGHDLAAYADAAAELANWAKANADKTPPADLPVAEAVWPFALHTFAFYVISDHALLPTLNDSRRRFYADSPRILIASAGPAVKNGTPIFQIEYDLRRDAIRAVARDSAADAGVAERKVWFGALEGALEHELGERYTAGGAKSTGLVSTSALLQSDGALALRGADASRTDALFADAEAAALAERDLKNGATLVVPRTVLRGGTSGWWAIEGTRGDVRAVLENGGGAIKGGVETGGSSAGQNASSGAKWDTSGNRSGSRFEPSKKHEKKGGGNEYLMMVAVVTIGIVIAAFLAVKFYQTVWMPTMAAQVQNAVQIGATADQQRR